jgi:4-amino-4-deoxy-L-arabinose transferase-like glycosyltransferase
MDTWLSSSLGFRCAAALLVAGLALASFWNLASEPPGRVSERRCVAVVSTMVQTGDWLVPELGGKPRLQKPPLFYWTGAATATLLGDTGSIAVRAPSALSALGLLALVILWARSLGGPLQGLAAGAALIGMLQLTTSARRGDAEMLLALLCTATLFAFDRVYRTRAARDFAWLGVLAGLAFLAKATAVLLVVAAPIAAFVALERSFSRGDARRALGAVLLALAIGLSWYVAILALVPGAFDTLWNDAVLPLGAGESGGDSRHFRSPLWYLSTLPARAAPASLLLPLVLWRLWSTRLHRGDPRRRLAALSFLVPFLAFSLLPQKQKHYTLVMLPGLALCSADALFALAPRVRAWVTRIGGSLVALAGLGVTLLFALFEAWIAARPAFPVWALAAALGALLLVALVHALRGRGLAFACAFVPALLLLVAVARGSVQVRAEQYEVQGFAGLTLDERERLLKLAREHPDLIAIFQIGVGSEKDD